jgi:hypothetical protein
MRGVYLKAGTLKLSRGRGTNGSSPSSDFCSRMPGSQKEPDLIAYVDILRTRRAQHPNQAGSATDTPIDRLRDRMFKLYAGPL